MIEMLSASQVAVVAEVVELRRQGEAALTGRQGSSSQNVTIHEVLKSGASFGVYDVMLSGDGELKYPLPWATELSASHLASSSHYARALENAGFKVSIEINRRDFAINFFKDLKSKKEKMLIRSHMDCIF